MWTKRSTPARAEASARVRVASMQPTWNSRQRSPVADLRRAVEDLGDVIDCPVAGGRIGQVAAKDLDAQLLEEPVRLPGRTRALTR